MVGIRIILHPVHRYGMAHLETENITVELSAYWPASLRSLFTVMAFHTFHTCYIRI